MTVSVATTKAPTSSPHPDAVKGLQKFGAVFHTHRHPITGAYVVFCLQPSANTRRTTRKCGVIRDDGFR